MRQCHMTRKICLYTRFAFSERNLVVAAAKNAPTLAGELSGKVCERKML